MRQKLLLVFWVSLLGLFLELCLIRWLPSQVRALSYFKNLVLISSFLGFGLGFMLKEQVRRFATLLPVLLLIEIGVALYLGQFRITGQSNIDEHLWLLYFDLPASAPIFPLTVALPVFYLLNTLTFIPIGQLLGAAMEDVGDSLGAYLVNVSGSIIGSLLFVLVSFMELGPRAWFIPTLIGLAFVLYRMAGRVAGIAAAAMALLLLVLPLARPGTLWSPYYALNIDPTVAVIENAEQLAKEASLPIGLTVSVNGSFHQSAINFSPEARAQIPILEQFYRQYAIPYDRYLAGTPQRAPGEVLVIGAGTGNDVALALGHGASHVDAVEIDPVIARVGQKERPDQVYNDPRVSLHIDDARHFLQSTDKKYDLVVFGTLDSQIALSALSNIRLDNYVYTVQSMEQVRRVLNPDGTAIFYFWAAQPWIKSRLAGMVEQAFGHAPQVAEFETTGLFNTLIMASANPAAPRVAEWEQSSRELLSLAQQQEIPTDDWPYLYQRERTLSTFYIIQIGVLLLLSYAAFVLTRRTRRDTTTDLLISGLHLPLFLQGMAFMLFETRSISVMALLFGTTWVVNAVVITAVLLFVLLANMAVRRFNIQGLLLPFVGLAVSLVIGYLFPISLLLHTDVLVRVVGGSLIYLTPIFFSSLIFAALLRNAQDLRGAYGSNLLGAVVGGFGEYMASITGLRALSLIGLAIFALLILIARYQSLLGGKIRLSPKGEGVRK